MIPDHQGFEIVSKSDTRHAAEAATLYAADNDGSYTGIDVMILTDYGFTQSQDVITMVTPTADRVLHRHLNHLS